MTTPHAEYAATRPGSNSDIEKHSAHALEHGDDRLHGLGDAVISDAAKEGHAVATDGHGHALLHIDPRAEARLRRKMDLYLIPILLLVYTWSFIDRINIGNARLYGIEKDLGMAGYDFNASLSVFYVAYIVFELPVVFLTKQLGPGWFLPITTIAFGLLSLCTAFVQNFSALCGVRFILGICEAAILPGTSYYLTRFYTRKEVTFRLGLFLLGAPLSGAFAGLLAYGIVNNIASVGSLKSWRILFLIEGLVTMAVGFIALAVMPNRPETAIWLNAEEKALAVARIKAEAAATTRVIETTRVKTLRSGLFNINAFLMGSIMLLLSIIVQGLSVFLPTIITAIYPTDTAVIRNLKTVPPFAVGLFFSALTPYLSSRFNKRWPMIALTMPLTIIGYILFIAPKSADAKYGGAFFITSSTFPVAALAYGWAGANTAPDGARAASMGLVAFLMNCGGLISTWTYLPYQAPQYYPGNGLNIACAFCIILLGIGAMLYCKWENKQRDAGRRDHRLHNKTAEEISLLGHHHPEFRYVY